MSGVIRRAQAQDLGALAALFDAYRRFYEQPADLPEIVWQVARPGDLVVCLGAVSITNWAYALPAALQELATARGGLRSVATSNSITGNAG